MTPKQRDAYIQAIKNFKPPEGYWEEVAKQQKEYDEYMQLEKHDGNCHCARCMHEFLNKE